MKTIVLCKGSLFVVELIVLSILSTAGVERSPTFDGETNV